MRRGDFSRMEVNVLSIIDQSGNFRPTKGKILLLSVDSLPGQQSGYGMKLLIRGQPEPVNPPLAPFLFDASKYWAGKKIYHQLWIKRETVEWIGPGSRSLFWWIQQNRQRAILKLKKQLPSKSESGVAAALIVGERSLLEKNIKQSYIESGAVHVLAVSGLHVGLVVIALNWLVSQFGKLMSISEWMKVVLLVTVVVLYVLFTGASPSVCRSGIMFTLWQIGSSFKFRGSSINTVLTAAFLMLWYQPALIYDVGFQLSYAAVLGILILYPRLSILWKSKWSPVNYFWQLNCVSIAAQLGTLPISLYYFHQFPVYFAFSSLLMIPLITIALASGLLLIALAENSLLADWAGWILRKLLQLCNLITDSIAQLPGHLITDIWLSATELLLFYALLFLLLRWLDLPKKYYLKLVLLLFLLLVSLRGIEWYKKSNQQYLVFYQYRSQLSVQIIQGLKSWYIHQNPGAIEKINYLSSGINSRLGIREALHYPATFQLEREDRLDVNYAILKSPQPLDSMMLSKTPDPKKVKIIYGSGKSALLTNDGDDKSKNWFWVDARQGSRYKIEDLHWNIPVQGALMIEIER